MGNFISIVVGFVGAGIGAYFAVVKSKTERLWIERYELINEITCDLDKLRYKFSADHMKGMGIQVTSEAEYKALNEMWSPE